MIFLNISILSHLKLQKQQQTCLFFVVVVKLMGKLQLFSWEIHLLFLWVINMDHSLNTLKKYFRISEWSYWQKPFSRGLYKLSWPFISCLSVHWEEPLSFKTDKGLHRNCECLHLCHKAFRTMGQNSFQEVSVRGEERVSSYKLLTRNNSTKQFFVLRDIYT